MYLIAVSISISKRYMVVWWVTDLIFCWRMTSEMTFPKLISDSEPQHDQDKKHIDFQSKYYKL